MSKHKIVAKLSRIGRTNDSDQWNTIDHKDLALWLEAEKSLSSIKYIHDGVAATVHLNLQPISAWYKKNLKANTEFHEAKARGETELGKYFPREKNIVLTAIITITGKNSISTYRWYPGFFLDKYIYDIFFILNIALPGSCEFLNLTVEDTEGKQSERYYLSAYNFECGYEDLLRKQPHAPIEIPLQQVIDWYQRLELGVKQKADSDIEKAIYSLLHMCKMDVDETSIVWIFHALEAIYKTKVGESFTNLINRITVLLELDTKSQKVIKKQLRELYDYRSSFVHGGYSVMHPLRNEVIDRRLNDDYDRTFRLGQIGFNLVVASIQRLIVKNWLGITVSEEITGLTFQKI